MNTNHHQQNGEDDRQAARLTAYALGQVDPRQRTEIEAELAATPEAQRSVKAIRVLAGRVREAAACDRLPERSPGLRKAIERRLHEIEVTPPPPPVPVRAAARKSWGLRQRLLAVAVGLAVVTVPVGLWLASQGPVRSVAVSEDAPNRLAAQCAPHTEAPTRSEKAEPFIDPSKLAPSPPAERKLKANGYAKPASSSEPQLSVDPDPSLDKKRILYAGSGLRAGPSSDSGSSAASPPSSLNFTQRAPRKPSQSAMDALPPDPAPTAAAGQPSVSMPSNLPGTVAFDENGRRALGSQAKPGDKPVQFAGRDVVEFAKEKVRHRNDLSKLSSYGGSNVIVGGPYPDVDLVEDRSTHSPHGRYYITTQTAPPTAPGTEQYDPIPDDGFHPVAKQPLSTFSIDVDTASYANVRRFLQQGTLPPRDAVRVEEMINYFPYHYAPPGGETPFAVHMEVAQCPWDGGHRLVRIALKGREVDRQRRGRSNLIFLLDVSGSMDEPNKLPLVKQAMKMLVDQLGEDDRVAVVTYSDQTAVRLESTNGTRKQAIRDCIDSLTAGGCTNGGAGIQLAYEQARRNFVKGGNNRVILATDGDLNVGITNDDDLVRLIQDESKSGVGLTVLGVGTGNLKDSKMEKLADRGHGVYAYLDSLREARKVLVEQLAGSTVTIAKDVKIQVEFNPSEVAAYRLIGYENRRMAARDFANDKKEAGDIGAGHAVTALYELVPARAGQGGEATELKYQRVPNRNLTAAAHSGELLTVRLRYKEPQAEKSQLLEAPLKDSENRFGQASADFQFAAAVASFGMLLRDSHLAGNTTLASVEEIAAATLGDDPGGYRAELVDLVRRARQIGR